jgi:antitoxin VapB
MAISIKNAETEQLARELAELTGESMTSAITAAVRDRLEKIRATEGDDLAERLVRIGKDCAKHLKEPFRTIDHGELLYDEKGLPR